jgi:hypothetical protein
MLATAVSGAAQTQQGQIPVPRPFPQPSQPSQPPPATTPSKPAGSATTTSRPEQVPPPPPALDPAIPSVRPSDQQLGVTVYPAAEFIDSYDAGRGQRIYLFGTNATFAEIVAYYRNTLRDGGHELFKTPTAMQEFDLGKFRDDTMSLPPSLVVKDYSMTADGVRSDGYLAVDGTREKHFKTVIQIVPATGK